MKSRQICCGHGKPPSAIFLSLFGCLLLLAAGRSPCSAAFVVTPSLPSVARLWFPNSHPVQDRRRFLRNSQDDDNNEPLLSKSITLALWTLPLDAIAIHWSHGWSPLINSWAVIQAKTSPQEFTAAFKFWFLGVISHPLMEAAFALSELLHACPGPRLAGLVPVSFLIASFLVATALIQWDKLRVAALSFSLAWFLAYIGSGLDGSSPSLLGDYNIQLDDDYQGRVVKGCPAPETIQSASVQQHFDYQKYQGRWYWHKVHDWTQFHQMYDTTLDIQLLTSTKDDGVSVSNNNDINGYINTLTIKGPSPTNSPLSWDKSPLLHGVRYSWKGDIDASSPRGVSQESGFGVSFPNYIIDATTTTSSEDYQEIIQFQCIQVGGVRLYEGIDFMSRSPAMTEPQLDAMHQRARRLYPYGASPEQMHRIEHLHAEVQPLDEPTMNARQALWKQLQVERYLDQSL